MKEIYWIGSSYDDLLDFPTEAKKDAGYNLHRLQIGLDPYDWKPMTSVGVGVREIRVHQEGEYRVLYIAKFSDAIYVLHSFIKKTQQTRKRDLDIAKERLKLINKRG